MKTSSLIWFLVYFVFGAYFINLGISYQTIPEIITAYNQIFFLIGGVLILYGGFNQFMFKRLKFKHTPVNQ
jgi:hypothetical protein